MSRFFVFLLLLLPNAAIGDEQIIWRIGKPDRDWSELAIAGKFQEYAARFGGKPIVFEVGRSEAEKDWPFIHPGPDDSGWAIRGYGSRTIGFDLPEAPRGVFRLRIEFVDTQSFNPPRYEITLGDQTVSFQLPRGGGDGSLADPRAGKPHKIELTLPVQMLKKGRNEIYLACTNGSWVQYDAVTLLADPEAILPPAEIESITLTPKPLFVRREGELRRVIDVSVSLTAPASDVRMMVEAGGRSIDVTRKQGPSFSLFSREVGLPDSSDPVEMKVTVAVGGRTKSVVETIPPQRKWLIFAAPSAHTDVGFTDIQPKCAELHNENTDAAIELMKRFPDFAWNLEVSWQAENYVNSRQGERLADFFRFAKEGRLGVQALYGNMLTGLCSAEEACRLTAYAHKLFREHGVPFQSAMITDLPTQEATLPMILSESGIRYFSCGDNDGRFKQMPHNRPYWWEGPDGSRVLMMQMRGYGHAYRWGLDAGVETARWRIAAALAEYDQRTDYPFDAVFLHGAFCDNLALNPKLAEVCRDWNERYAFPKIILCRNAEFFEYIEKKYGEQLPAYRGSGGTYWEDGAGSSARETALTRNAQAAVGNGEKFLALAERIGGKP
ncbi:MAG: hypothetical protein GXY83_29855, partial [Rhodopirellula sp.]|nr:hypothetical protein [Rhodopirellula sp.]